MSFYGSSFSFDGISCEEYGLMLYDFGSKSQGDSEYAPGMKIYEDRVRFRTRSLFYGTNYEDPLEFKLVFGADEHAAYHQEPLDRQDMEVIGSWLTGHNEYKWLVIDQPDMAGIRYRCILTDLKTIEVSMNKWAFECEVHCDSPFAYLLPQQFIYTTNGSSDAILQSRSSSNLPYSPILTISMPNGGDISIVNHSNRDETFAITGVPVGTTMTVDSERGIISATDGYNLYKNFNFVFPTLVRGDNNLTITGNATVTYTCEFPVNVGG